ncbi:MAG: hypothetical protein V7675_16690 [Hyphomonas sp.]|uniref:hypothetical protein n=1 Tax=Hyphomonas sp. TaxID=87 RepID=UPI0030010E28
MAKAVTKTDAVSASDLAERFKDVSEAESRVAQRLLDATLDRPPPPKVRFSDDGSGFSMALEHQDPERALIALHSVTGVRNNDAVNMLLDQLTRLAASDMDKLDATRTNRAIAMMDEIKPSDGPEAMLAAQMVAVHVAAMQCFSRALMGDQTFMGRDLNLKHGAKLTRIYAQQVEALDKHRRKGQQTVVVEHVHVNDGGQAIVGSVSSAKI